jgi:hypothetical protein
MLEAKYNLRENESIGLRFGSVDNINRDGQPRKHLQVKFSSLSSGSSSRSRQYSKSTKKIAEKPRPTIIDARSVVERGSQFRRQK